RRPAQPSRRPTEKAHQPIRLSQRKSLQDDRFRFPGGHEQSARRRCAEPVTFLSETHAHAERKFLSHAARSRNAWRRKNTRSAVKTHRQKAQVCVSSLQQ